MVLAMRMNNKSLTWFWSGLDSTKPTNRAYRSYCTVICYYECLRISNIGMYICRQRLLLKRKMGMTFWMDVGSQAVIRNDSCRTLTTINTTIRLSSSLATALLLLSIYLIETSLSYWIHLLDSLFLITSCNHVGKC